ncbi:bifunctional folylpolyglutamate synthase/dihydrofolate synthase [Tumebacillus sp. DT12]|uniref:tetrahydrofolate synthase n=1 Tax=Tumebacillus lacus TaxID=2995335 RepID=A0ABT3X608_9BACL|nr:folylpolyglutamate synthase/dihydrofolate synthase family protein [Tumebacillus lacus]MCX7571388.1 bifunctional folylpolyglutamate synthase/dihydrofolate synthase [Tumebacillus lacus]
MSATDWIHSFDRFDGRKGIKPGLERMEAMLLLLGQPHRDLRFVHVAGTNGKGSTCAFLASVLEQAGYRVGLYTSPYLSAFGDRMRIGGCNITDDALDALVDRVKPVVEEVAATVHGRPTEFEVITLLSILFYAQERVDFVVWETGLGGRLDATNVVTPLLSLITNVGRDHEAILGQGIERIAVEKAGIIKPGVPVLTTAKGVALDVIERTAREQGAPCYAADRDFSAKRTAYGLDGQSFDWRGIGDHHVALRIRLLGPHQIDNAALALAACVQLRRMGVAITGEAMQAGLKSAAWPGRLEIVSQSPLTLLDGAHNPEGAAALAAALKELLPNRRLIFVIGILADKAIPDVLAPLTELAAHVIVTRPDMDRAAQTSDVADAVRTLAPTTPVETMDRVSSALYRATVLAMEQRGAVICTGSLYMISEARAVLVP